MSHAQLTILRSLSLKVLRCDESQGIVIARCLNTASIGERKNCNLPGVKVDLPTLSEKDIIDLEEWAIPNRVDFLAASFIRKASDLAIIRNVLGDSLIHIISKIENQEGAPASASTPLFPKLNGCIVRRAPELRRHPRRERRHHGCAR